MKIEFKGTAGIVASVVLLIGAGAWVVHQRNNLREQGLPQVEEFVKSELTRSFLEETRGRHPTPAEIASLEDFEVLELRPPLFPRKFSRVRVLVLTKDGEREFYLRFKRVLGSWRLQGETHEPLLSW